MELHRHPRLRVAQALQPGPQQWRSLHVRGKHAPGGADKGVNAQILRPAPHACRIHTGQRGAEGFAPLPVPACKRVHTLRVGQVQAATPGQQKFATHRGHAIKHMHLHASLRQNLRSHQSRRSATQDGDLALLRRDLAAVDACHGCSSGSTGSMHWPVALKNAARTVWPG